MTKVYIDADEWYPVYQFDEDPPRSQLPYLIEVDAMTVARWRQVFDEFDAVQAELEKLSKARQEV